MITILHGDNEPQMHVQLVTSINAARENGTDIIRLDAKKIEISTLETTIGTEALFATQKLIIIDGLFALPKSKKKDGFLAWIQDHDLPANSIILTEKKALTAAQLKAIPGAKVTVFKYPAVLFQWLETLGSVPPARELELFHQVLAREDAELAFIMLVRQVRTLLSFVADGVYDGPPFLRSKIGSQARYFTKEKLLKLHTRLLELDEGQKTSRNSMTLTQNLDLLLVEL